jgi:hypothetical protein
LHDYAGFYITLTDRLESTTGEQPQTPKQIWKKLQTSHHHK